MNSFTIPVAHVNYTVRFLRVVKYKGKKVHGLCDPKTRTISVEMKSNVELIRQIVWHEFLHALFHELEQVIDGEDESVTDNVATAIMRVRLEQPWL